MKKSRKRWGEDYSDAHCAVSFPGRCELPTLHQFPSEILYHVHSSWTESTEVQRTKKYSNLVGTSDHCITTNASSSFRTSKNFRNEQTKPPSGVVRLSDLLQSNAIPHARRPVHLRSITGTDRSWASSCLRAVGQACYLIFIDYASLELVSTVERRSPPWRL